jgi:hypothetical protein
MSRRAAILVTITALITVGLEGDPRAVQGKPLPMLQSVQMYRSLHMNRSMQAQECNCSGFFYGYADISSPPSFGPIYDGGAFAANPGACGGFCAGWAYVTAASLCGYQSGTVAVYGTWNYSSPSGSGQGQVTDAEC